MVKKKSVNGVAVSADSSGNTFSLLHTSEKDVDPLLASLFQSSAGPVAPPKKRFGVPPPKADQVQHEADAPEESESSEPDDEIDSSNATSRSSSVTSSADALQPTERPTLDQKRPSKKRKRRDREDDVEERYMQRLAAEEAKEETIAKRKRKKQGVNDVEVSTKQDAVSSDSIDDDEGESSLAEASDEDNLQVQEDNGISQHESRLNLVEHSELDQASRTVFLGNVSTQTILSKSAKKKLLHHLASFFPSLPATDGPHKVESIRFRSTAYAFKLPKKTSFIRKELMDATTQSTNAYAVYSSKLAAREAVKHLNGTVVLERHLRVDQVAHPAKVDHRRCVFVGNLDFVDDESKHDEKLDENGEEKPKKKKKTRPPADVEEGLWQQFAKAGTVESVRVIRDQQTRIGKGFAYVQFTDENAVEAALLFNDKNFPPLLPRKIRVMRAKANKRNSTRGPASRKPEGGIGDRTLQGRAGRLLGRAGAAQARNPEKWNQKRQCTAPPGNTSEAIVFEGHRAQSKDGSGLKFGAGKRKGKLNNRSAKRASAWRKSNKK